MLSLNGTALTPTPPPLAFHLHPENSSFLPRPPHPLPHPHPPFIPFSMPAVRPREFPPKIDRKLVRFRHGNRLSRRSLNIGHVKAPVAMVHWMNRGSRRVEIHDNGTVATTTSAHSALAVLKVLLLCEIAGDLNLDFPPCQNKQTGERSNSSVLQSVLLLFNHSNRFLCVNRKGKVYSLSQDRDRGSSGWKVSDCVFQHEIISSQFDTYHSRRPPLGSSPSLGRRRQHSGDRTSPVALNSHAGRRYLCVKDSKVVTRKVPSGINPPKKAFFIQLHLKEHEQGRQRSEAVRVTPSAANRTSLAAAESKAEPAVNRKFGGTTRRPPPLSVFPPAGKKGQRRCRNRNLLGGCSKPTDRVPKKQNEKETSRIDES